MIEQPEFEGRLHFIGDWKGIVIRPVGTTHDFRYAINLTDEQIAHIQQGISEG